MEFDVTIEIPKGQRNKYEVDHETGRIRLDRTLFTSTAVPGRLRLHRGHPRPGRRPARRAGAAAGADVPGLPDPLPRDRHVPDDGRGRRRRQGAVRARRTTRAWSTCATSTTCSKFDRLEIQHFFEVYKDLEPGKSVEGANWVGRAEAEAEVRAVLRAVQGEPARGLDQARPRRRTPVAPPATDPGHFPREQAAVEVAGQQEFLARRTPPGRGLGPDQGALRTKRVGLAGNSPGWRAMLCLPGSSFPDVRGNRRRYRLRPRKYPIAPDSSRVTSSKPAAPIHVRTSALLAPGPSSPATRPT